MICFMMLMALAVAPPVVSNEKFNYFDMVAVVWLIIGFFRGRKHGLSQELLPMLLWLGIVVAGGLYYARFSGIVHQYTQFGPLWSNVTSYLLIALGVYLIYRWFRQMFAEKLVEKDPFGRGEYYLGMTAGVVRFACMIVVAMSLMNSRVATAAELAQMEKFQARWFSDIRFPTYGEFQQDALLKSFSGKWVETHLKPVLIASVTYTASPASPEGRPTDTIAQQKNKEIDEILGSSRR
jgi:uncharacterized membrane protein required for colicin V production